MRSGKRAVLILLCLLILAGLFAGLCTAPDVVQNAINTPCPDITRQAGNGTEDNSTQNDTEQDPTAMGEEDEGIDNDEDLYIGDDDNGLPSDKNEEIPLSSPGGDADDDDSGALDDDIDRDDHQPSSWTSYFEQGKLLAIAAIFVGVVIFFMAVFLIYTKIKHDQLLNHEMRKRIHDHVRDHPGQHFRSIMTDMGLKSGVLTHHINMLEREEYIKSVQDGMYRRFYIYGVKVDSKHLLTQHQQNILNAIRADPGLSQTDIANKIGITRMLVNYHLKVLTTEGLAFVKKKGRSSSCFPVEENT